MNAQLERSQEAERAIDKEPGQALLVAVLREVGAEGMTDQEMQRCTFLDPSTQRPRRGELVAKGLVVDSGRKRTTQSGRQATVWVATEFSTKEGA